MEENDQTKATRLIAARTEGAKIHWEYFYKSKRFWIAVILISTFTVGAYVSPADIDMNRGIFCLLGFFIGRILRDILWMKKTVDGFPFMEKIIDWDKVEKLAKEG